MGLLAGMVRDDHGRPMSWTHAQNHGSRYTYYASNMNDDAEALALRLPVSENEMEGVFEPIAALGLADAAVTALVEASFRIALGFSQA